MSNSNGFPEWLRELGAKVDQLVEQGKRTDARINALVDTAKLQQGMLNDVITALEGQVQINQEVNERLERMEGKRPQ